MGRHGGSRITTGRPMGDALRDQLILTHWLSPAFPLGAFAYSHGLEWTIAQGEIGSAEEAAAQIGAILTSGSGWCDAVLLSLVHRGAIEPEPAIDLARALASGAERWEETCALGRAFRATLGVPDIENWPMPVALGLQARGLGLPTQTVVALYLQGVAVNLMAVATRAVPLGQAAANGALAGLMPRIAALAREASDAGVDALASGTPGADLAAMAHETQAVRLFRS